MNWKVTTEPASEPLTTSDVKNYLKVEFSDDDTLIDLLIKSSRQWIERHCRLALLPQTITEIMDSMPVERGFYLNISPLRSITGIYYKDTDGNQQTWASGNYVTDAISYPPRIQRAYGVTSPTIYDEIASVSAVYVCGFDDAASVPAPIKRAMMLMVADSYENREDYVKRLPTAAEIILESSGYRIWEFH